MPYNQYLTSLGACVDVKTQWKENDPGSFIQYIHLAYPGLENSGSPGWRNKGKAGYSVRTCDPAASARYKAYFSVFL